MLCTRCMRCSFVQHERSKLVSVLAELKECTRSRDLQTGRRIHSAVIESGHESNTQVANTLINMYGKCGSMGEASRLFERIHSPTVVSWNVLIFGYVENGNAETALDSFSQMCSAPNSTTFVASLKACIDLASTDVRQCRQRGKSLHLLASSSGYDSNMYVGNTLVELFAKCNDMDYSRGVFNGMKCHNVVSWTCLIWGYVAHGEAKTALYLFSRMQPEGCAPNERTFVAAIQACNGSSMDEDQRTERGKALHALAVCSGQMDMFVECTLVDMYAKHGNMRDAREVFESMKQPVLVAWNALMLGYADNGEGRTALDLFIRMLCEKCSPDTLTFVAAFKACTDLSWREEGCDRSRATHFLATLMGFDSEVFVGNALVDMYSKCGRIDDACKVFDSMKQRDVVSWSALILGYVDIGENETALCLFARMRHESAAPDALAFVAALRASEGKLGNVKALHLLASCTGEVDLYVDRTLVDLYARCWDMETACSVFHQIKKPETPSWNTLIVGYAEFGEGENALAFFCRMSREGCMMDEVTFVGSLKACNDLLLKEKCAEKLVNRVQGLHLLAARTGCDLYTHVENSLVDMYAKCRLMDQAFEVFKCMKHPDVVAWTALLMGYADNGEAACVLTLFQRMKREGCEPNAFTFVAVLKACVTLVELDFGREVHVDICNRGFEEVPILAASLVNFYAKCGSLVEAERIFKTRSSRDLVAWTALMTGHSNHGNFSEVFRLFHEMREDGLHPDRITLLCVLNACSHAGLVEEGTDYFEAMSRKYGVPPDVEHCTCMIDVLGRANKLDDAMAVLRSMPLSPDGRTWKTILGASQKWKYAELGRLAFESLDDKDAVAYVLMSNT